MTSGVRWRIGLLAVLVVIISIIALRTITTRRQAGNPVESLQRLSSSVQFADDEPAAAETRSTIETDLRPPPEGASSTRDDEVEAPSPCAAASGPGDPIIIGAILPLSSPGAYDAGFTMQFALNSAAKIANRDNGVHGRPVRIITYDSAGIPRSGALHAERLITQDCAVMLVGLYHDNVAAAVLEVAAAYNTPVIIAGAQDERLTAGQSPVAFRIAPTQALRNRNLLAFLTDYFSVERARVWRDGAATVIIVTENQDLSGDAREEVTAGLEAAGITAKTLTAALPISDLSPVITRIVAESMPPDAIIIDLPAADAVQLQALLLDLGIGPPSGTLVILDGADQVRQMASIQAADSHAVASWDGPWPTTASDAARPLVMDFKEYFNRWPEPIAFHAYDSLLLAVDALCRAYAEQEEVSSEALIAALEATDVDLAEGHYRFAYGSAHPPGADGAPLTDWHQWLEPPLLFLQRDESAPATDPLRVIWP